MSAAARHEYRLRHAGTLAVAAAGVALWLVAGAGARRLREASVRGGLIAGRRARAEAVASALGGFRGLASDFLWLRAIQMREEGDFDELALLYKLILDLQPRFTSVWTYSSWNFAYNLAFEANTPEERWHWIDKGIKLLEEDGIHRNRNSWEIPWEIGYTYYFRVSRLGADPFYRHYQERIAPVPDWCREASARRRRASVASPFSGRGGFEFVDKGLWSDRGVRYRLYRRRCAAGRVTLGSAKASGGAPSRAKRMYVVLVKPAEALARAARLPVASSPQAAEPSSPKSLGAGGGTPELARTALTPGARLYSDAPDRVGPRRLHDVPGAGPEPSVPAELEGAALVVLPDGDRSVTSEAYLSLELARPAEVWVGWFPDEARNFHIAREWLARAERLSGGRMLMVSRLRVHALVQTGEWERGYEEFVELMLTRPAGDPSVPAALMSFLLEAVFGPLSAGDRESAEMWHGRLRANFPQFRVPDPATGAASPSFPSPEDVARYVASIKGVRWHGVGGEERDR